MSKDSAFKAMNIVMDIECEDLIRRLAPLKTAIEEKRAQVEACKKRLQSALTKLSSINPEQEVARQHYLAHQRALIEQHQAATHTLLAEENRLGMEQRKQQIRKKLLERLAEQYRQQCLAATRKAREKQLDEWILHRWSEA